MTGWMKVKPASKYAGVSERTFRNWLKTGLRHCRLPTGTILVQPMAIDEHLQGFETNSNQLDSLVDEVLQGL